MVYLEEATTKGLVKVRPRACWSQGTRTRTRHDLRHWRKVTFRVRRRLLGRQGRGERTRGEDKQQRRQQKKDDAPLPPA